MTMTVQSRSMTLAEWDQLEVEGSAELVQGVLVMSPSESFLNRRAAARVSAVLGVVPGIEWVQEMDILLDDDPLVPTVRCPDVVVLRAGSVGDVARLDPADVVLVVEVVSESSVETDWVTKRREYAQAGIPAYLVVDRHAGRLVLFDRIVEGRYADAVGDGVSVTLRLGEHTLPLRLDDLLE